MGREAVVYAQVGSEAGDIRAVLESRELILRGDIRRTFALSDLAQARVELDVLVFLHGPEEVRLMLGATMADKWARAMTTPPPSLRAKLGLGNGTQVFCLGQVDEPELADALDGAISADLHAAGMVVARIDSAADLERLLAFKTDLPVWTVYPKGALAGFGGAPIRTRMREADYIDSKSCAVSERLTATRYGRRKV